MAAGNVRLGGGSASEVISMLMGMFPAGLSVYAYVCMMNAAVGPLAQRGLAPIHEPATRARSGE